LIEHYLCKPDLSWADTLPISYSALPSWSKVRSPAGIRTEREADASGTLLGRDGDGRAVGSPAGGGDRTALFDDWPKADARRREQIESGGWLRALYLTKSPIRRAVLAAGDACRVEIAVPYGRCEILNNTAGRLKNGRHTQ